MGGASWPRLSEFIQRRMADVRSELLHDGILSVLHCQVVRRVTLLVLDVHLRSTPSTPHTDSCADLEILSPHQSTDFDPRSESASVATMLHSVRSRSTTAVYAPYTHAANRYSGTYPANTT